MFLKLYKNLLLNILILNILSLREMKFKKFSKFINIEKALTLAEKWGKKADVGDVKKVEIHMDKMNRGPLRKIWNKVLTLWEGFKSSETPVWTKTVIIGSLVYMIAPLDLIPDAIPVAGLIDDAAVVCYAFDILRKAVKKTEDKINAVLRDRARKQIRIVLNDFTKKVVLHALLRLAVFASAIFILRFAPVDFIFAMYAASVMILSVPVWFFFQWCSCLPVVIESAKNLYREKNIKNAAVQTVMYTIENDRLRFFFKWWSRDKFPKVIPRIDELWKDFKNYFAKRLIITGVVLALYVVIFVWIVYPFVMKTFTGYTSLQVVLFPFKYSADILFKTNFSGMF